MLGKLLDTPRQVHILIIIFLILTFISLSRSSLAQPQVTITLSEAGIAKVEYLVPTEGNLSVTVQLLGTPDPTLGVTVVDEKGLPLAFDTDQTGRYLTVATLNSSQVYVSYYTQDLTSKSGIFWIISVNSPYPLKVFLPVNATPVDMNILPTKIYSIGRNLAIEYPAGSLQLKYVILARANKTADTLLNVTRNVPGLERQRNRLQLLEQLLARIQERAKGIHKQLALQLRELVQEAINLAEKAPEMAKNNPGELARQAQDIGNRARQMRGGGREP